MATFSNTASFFIRFGALLASACVLAAASAPVLSLAMRIV